MEMREGVLKEALSRVAPLPIDMEDCRRYCTMQVSGCGAQTYYYKGQPIVIFHPAQSSFEDDPSKPNFIRITEHYSILCTTT